MTQTHFFQTEKDLMNYASQYASQLQGGEILALIGDLGCGKTTFVKGLVQGLGSLSTVTSPTFNLVHRYPGGRLDTLHFDLYRLKNISEIEALDLENEIEIGNSIIAIEWPQLVDPILPRNRTRILEFKEENEGRSLNLIR